MIKNKELYNQWAETYDINENKTRDLNLIARFDRKEEKGSVPRLVSFLFQKK